MNTKPRVLIVDDEERFRTTMAKLLTVNGLEVTAVGSGKAALEELKAKPYDVITLDIRMPEMSGLEALAEIKKINPGVEVIILTGHASVDTAMEIMKLGGYEYLLKPTSTEELMNKIDAAYERKLTREQKTRKGQDS